MKRQRLWDAMLLVGPPGWKNEAMAENMHRRLRTSALIKPIFQQWARSSRSTTCLPTAAVLGAKCLDTSSRRADVLGFSFLGFVVVML